MESRVGTVAPHVQVSPSRAIAHPLSQLVMGQGTFGHRDTYLSLTIDSAFKGHIDIHEYTGSFSKVVLSHRAVNQVFLGVFLMFSAFFHSKLWAKFHFGTFEPYK